MANRGLKEDDVFNAAFELEKQNTNPTASAVREFIGSGSMTTISKHLKNWNRKKMSYISEISNVDLKQVLTGIDDNILCEFLENEMPQVTALTLSHLAPKRVANILSLMTPKKKEDILNKIENMAPVKSEITELLARSIQSEIESLIVIQDHQLGGKSFANSVKAQMAQ